jgi:hypothetical protein
MIVAFACAIVFLGIASFFKPEPRGAAAVPTNQTVTPPREVVGGSGSAQFRFRNQSLVEPAANDEVARRLGRTTHTDGWRLLGQLEGREHRVLIFASPEGPRYSVYSLSGELLQADLAADDVYRAFPDLELGSLRDVPASDGKTIMLAPTPD